MNMQTESLKGGW